MFTEINSFISGAAIILGIVIAALQFAGVLNVAIARILLVVAWVVAVIMASASLNDAPASHRLIAAALVAVPFGIFLFIVERWISKKSAATAVQKTEKENSEPNIVCLGDDDLFVSLDRHEVFRETDNHAPGTLRAATVKFANEPKPGKRVGSVSQVRAQIVFYRTDWPDREDYRVDYGCWLNEESPYVSFNLSDNAVHQLIVGVFQLKKDGGDGYEPELRIYGNSPDRNRELSRYVVHGSTGYRVRVRLIVGEHGEHSSEHDFELDVEPGSSYSFGYITEEEKRLRRESLAQELEKFVREGEKLLAGPIDTNSEQFYLDAHAWMNPIYGWLRRIFGLPLAGRYHDFTNLRPFPHEIPGGRNTFLDELYTRYINLKEITEDFKSGKVKLPFEL